MKIRLRSLVALPWVAFPLKASTISLAEVVLVISTRTVSAESPLPKVTDMLRSSADWALSTVGATAAVGALNLSPNEPIPCFASDSTVTSKVPTPAPFDAAPVATPSLLLESRFPIAPPPTIRNPSTLRRRSATFELNPAIASFTSRSSLIFLVSGVIESCRWLCNVLRTSASVSRPEAIPPKVNDVTPILRDGRRQIRKRSAEEG
jgi:hypothetical protein